MALAYVKRSHVTDSGDCKRQLERNVSKRRTIKRWRKRERSNTHTHTNEMENKKKRMEKKLYSSYAARGKNVN